MKNTSHFEHSNLLDRSYSLSDVRFQLPLFTALFFILIVMSFWPMRHTMINYRLIYLPIVKEIPKNNATSVRLTKERKSIIVADTSIIYGPLPLEKVKTHGQFESYSYLKVYKSFNSKVSIHRISELRKDKFKTMLISQVPNNLKENFQKYLKSTLELSEKMQIDPFWVLSIMWTESHFKSKAASHKNAQGLMQIMPATGHFITHLMNQKVAPQVAHELIRLPLMNIKMGIIYLNHLLEMFNYNYKLATVAYNMGPYWVIRRLRNRLPVGVRNNYLDKVRNSYSHLTRHYKSEIKNLPMPYKSTLVTKSPKKQPLDWFDKKFFSFLDKSFVIRLAQNSFPEKSVFVSL